MHLKLGDVKAAVKHAEWLETRIGANATCKDIFDYLNHLTPDDLYLFLGKVKSMVFNCAILSRQMDEIRIPIEDV